MSRQGVQLSGISNASPCQSGTSFAVIRQAMKEKDVVGISRLVLNRRERATLLEPGGNGIVLWTLRYGDEVRDPAEFFKDIDPARADSKLLNLVGDLIDERSKPWNPKMVDGSSRSTPCWGPALVKDGHECRAAA